MDIDPPGKIELIAELPGMHNVVFYTLFPLSDLIFYSGHTGCAWAVAWNPVKPLLASCSADKSVRLYNYQDGKGTASRFSLSSAIDTGHGKAVRALAWSPSGNTLATGSFDSNIGIWQQQISEDGEGEEWECVSLLEGHETECKGVAYSASGTLLASCSRDKSVWLWERTFHNMFAYEQCP